MLPGTIHECTTDTISLIINPKESWKVHPDDTLLFGSDNLRREQHEEAHESAAVEERGPVHKLGDDLAEEGQLGRTF
jgi:hypothetical protein